MAILVMVIVYYTNKNKCSNINSMELQTSQENGIDPYSLLIDSDLTPDDSKQSTRANNSIIGAAGLRGVDTNPSDFYTSSRKGITAEGRRLESMADMYGGLSEGLIGPVADRVVLDAGAGNSSSLGVSIKRALGEYLALDIRPDAVEGLKRAGLNARVASVTETGLDPSSVDVVHSRLTWGWLSTVKERQAAFLEAVRVLRGESHAGSESRMVIMDANWEVASGPREFRDAVRATSACMADMGFDPFYGHKAGRELREWSELCSRKDGLSISVVGPGKTPIFSGRIADIMPHIKEVGDSVIGGLEDLGQEDHAAKLRQLYAELSMYAEENPDAEVEAIDMFAHVLVVKKDENYRRSEQSIPERQVNNDCYIEGSDFFLANPDNPGLEDVVVAKSPEMILAARRIQANAYVRKGLVEAGALQNGVLPNEIDPESQVKRSKYFLTLDDQKRICGMVRCIEPDSRRSVESLPGAISMGFDGDPAETVVISAFARNFDVKSSFADPVMASIGLVDYVRVQRYKQAIMELESGQQTLINAVFGEDSLSNKGSGKIQGSGVKQDKSYVYLLGEVAEFPNSVWNHVDGIIEDAVKKGTKLNPLFKKMNVALESMLDPKTSR